MINKRTGCASLGSLLDVFSPLEASFVKSYKLLEYIY